MISEFEPEPGNKTFYYIPGKSSFCPFSATIFGTKFVKCTRDKIKIQPMLVLVSTTFEPSAGSVRVCKRNVIGPGPGKL